MDLIENPWLLASVQFSASKIFFYKLTFSQLGHSYFMVNVVCKFVNMVSH